MSKVAFLLEHAACLEEDEAEELPFGQAHWWLRQGSDFVKLPKKIRGDSPIKETVYLEPGEYILGCGPARGGVRVDITVEAGAAPAPEPEKPKAKGKGKAKAAEAIDVSGQTIVITGDLSLDRDDAKAWLVGLGAKVSSSISGKTTLLVVGTEPGQKKLEEAATRGIRTITEEELRASLGEPPPAAEEPAPKLAKGSKSDAWPPAIITKMVATVEKDKPDRKKVDKLVGPDHFADSGFEGNTLWGVCIGPRGGNYYVLIDLKDRPRFGFKCNCTGYGPCHHALALLFTAQKHFIPPAPPPDGHDDRSRYIPFGE